MKIMKKLRLIFLVSCLLSMTFSLTSCLNNNGDDSSTTGYAIARISSSFGSTAFVSGGYTLSPSATSLATVESTYGFSSTSGMAFLYYTYDLNSDANKNYATTKVIYIELLAAYSLENTVESVQTVGAANDSTATASVVALQSPYDESANLYLDTSSSSTYLLTGINYYMTGSLANTHYFTLVYYPNKTEAGDDTMVLYLRHNSKDTSAGYTSSSFVRTVPSYYYKSFNITQFIQEFTTKAGGKPSKIVVHINQSNLSGSLSDASDESYSVTLK